MLFLIPYLFFVGIVAVAARSKGRSGIAWGLVALFFSPLIAGFFLLIMSDNRERRFLSLQDEMRDEVIRQRYGPYIRSYKPAFSRSIVYETSIGGQKRRFKKRAEALVHVAALVDAQQPVSLPAPVR